MLQLAYGEDCLSRTQCHEWNQRFRSGRTSVEDGPKSGRPSTSMDDDDVEKVLAMIRQNRRVTVCEFAEEVPTPQAPTCPCGLRGLPFWAWQKCNRLLRLGRP